MEANLSPQEKKKMEVSKLDNIAAAIVTISIFLFAMFACAISVGAIH